MPNNFFHLLTPGLRHRQIKETFTDNTLASMTKAHFDQDALILVERFIQTKNVANICSIDYTLGQKFCVHRVREMTLSDHATDIPHFLKRWR